MTALQIYNAVGVELNKMKAPSLKLYEFNYLINKAINQYVNKVYNRYDLNQQSTDDLRVLKSTAYLTPKLIQPQQTLHNNSAAAANSYLSRAYSSISSLNGASYEAYLPIDYYHLLNCVCVYRVNKTHECHDAGSYIQVPALRLTADAWSSVIDDIYNRPSWKRPYYYLHNQNNQTNNAVLPTDPITAVEDGMPNGTDMGSLYKVISNGKVNDTGNVWEMEYPNPEDTVLKTADMDGKASSNFPRTFKLDLNGDGTPDTNVSLVEKPIGLRMGNTSNVRLEIRYGKDNTVYELVEVAVDYVKCPQHIRITQEQLDLTEDTSQIMEFPDYVNQEIINELVHLIMEHELIQRLPVHKQITESIAQPAQQQAQSQPSQS